MADKMTFQFLDVGMGDGTLVQIRADGDDYDRLMLVDFGEKRSKFPVAWRSALKYLVRTINDNSKARGRSRPYVDHLVLTHPDGDHHNKIKALVEADFPDYPKEWLYFGDLHYSGRAADYDDKLITDTLKGLVDAKNGLDEMVNNYHSKVTAAGFKRPWKTFGPVDVYMLSSNWPDDQAADPNDMSIVLLFDLDGKRVILPGDATKRTEKHILDDVVNAKPSLVDCEGLKLGHHGSNGSSHPRWVKATRPRAIFASGDNVWAHPYCKPICAFIDDGYLSSQVDDIWYMCGHADYYYNNVTRDMIGMNLWYVVERKKEQLYDEESEQKKWFYDGNTFGVQWELVIENGRDRRIHRTETYIPDAKNPDPPFDCKKSVALDEELRREQLEALISQLPATPTEPTPA